VDCEPVPDNEPLEPLEPFRYRGFGMKAAGPIIPGITDAPLGAR
jgi:hypothetical protein